MVTTYQNVGNQEINRLLVAKDYEKAQAVSFIDDAIENETHPLRVCRLRWVRTFILQSHKKKKSWWRW